ncbi:MAG TPA: TIR domain-containing protein [Caulobacteraceae bacterium]|nr:TIR domain-containing protein [Caulobacteraceae bacterium]
MPDVFISYARSSARPAQLITEALRSEGYSVWFDEDLPAHGAFSAVIEERLRSAKAVLVLWSKDAVHSRWVPAEADIAHEAGTLVQFSLDGVLPPLPFNRSQCASAPGWAGDFEAPAWRKVAASIAELVNRAAPAPSGAALPAATSVKAAAKEPVLAVLAFDNLSSAAELGFFCDGVAEEILNTVAQGVGIKVLARSSTFQFRGRDKAAAQVGAALGASHILDGAVRRSGSQVRITATLVDCQSQSTLWASRFDGDLDDVFALQDRIAASVADALKVKLLASAGPAPLDPATYELFLRARGVVNEADGPFDEASAAAIPLLEQAVAASPGYAPAWELLALVRARVLRGGHRQGPYEAGRAGVLQAANAALALDSRRGGAYTALSLLEPWGAYAARGRLLERALALAPNDAAALSGLSTFRWSVGRFREALGFAERACELDPLAPAALLQLAEMRAYAGDYEGSIRMAQDLHRRWPRNFQILVSLLNNSARHGFWDAYEGASKAAEAFAGEGWQRADLHASQAYAVALESGDAALQRERLRRYGAVVERTGTVPLNLVEAVASFGMAKEAFALAARASFDHMFDPDGPLPSAYFPGVLLSPWANSLNRFPEFVALADRMGLCAYWLETAAWPDCVEWTPYDFKAAVRRQHSTSGG